MTDTQIIGETMKDQFEIIHWTPAYDGGHIPIWKCNKCEQVDVWPSTHKCPPLDAILVSTPT